MSPRSNPTGPPGRLVDVPGDTAELLARANREFELGADEVRAFKRLEVRLDRSEPRAASLPRQQWLVPLVAGFALAVLMLLFVPRALEDPGAHVLEHEVVRPRSVSKEPSANTAAPTAAATALSKGKQRLPDGTLAELAPGTAAEVRRLERGMRVDLDRGSIELRVASQAPGSRFEVASGAYRFEVLGTVFRVAAAADRVTLEVSEGRVGVWQGSAEIARIGAGERWASAAPVRVAPTALLRSAPAPSASGPAPSAPGPDCLALARDGDPKTAERCFEERTRGAGLSAEVALYEMARLRRDVLGDTGGALQALGAYRARFPDGSLRREVDISYVELLARLGRHAEALAESGRLLTSASGRERAGELHLLRGNIYRKSLGDPAAAEREYAEAARSGGTLGAEALFFRAVSFEALGDRARARALYEEYSSAPRRPRHAEAQKRLQALSP